MVSRHALREAMIRLGDVVTDPHRRSSFEQGASGADRSGAPSIPVIVVADGRDPASAERAKRLAAELSVPLRELGEDGPASQLVLTATAERLELYDLAQRRCKPIVVDFQGGTMGYRRTSLRSGKQPIARAVGLRGQKRSVLDATGGLGRDAFVLACLGCSVTIVERSPVLAAMLRDGFARAAACGDAGLREVVSRMTLIEGDACDVLDRTEERYAPDVVYVDPMYPPTHKSALVKNELRMLRSLVGTDPDAASLVELARRVALDRVVVKRHRHAPSLAGDPDTTYVGRRVRYDVHFCNRQ